ncbi:MAG TPA: glycosyltransferase family 4 protein [Tessaracoccus flavescens]|uniref:Glycosyltransferase family 4 protein n=1 Tax=Tessaracoccus flavescens TaxID=399497 RepID=A0A921EMC1_9ACTN|nr:glycosyltransferase family 4 protein [Tessaracoccus flavescens]
MSRIGYVLKVYPRFSETFIVTEILAREAHGDDLSIYALRPTTDARFHPEIARVKAGVTWISRYPKGADLWARIADGVANADLRERFAAILPELATLPGDEVAQGVELAQAVLADGITHLHAHFATLAGRMAWIASRLTGVPYTLTTHAKDIYHDSVDPVWLRRLATDADRVIAISRFNDEHLATVLDGTGARVSLQYNALELDRFPFRTPAEPRDTLKVAAVGRLVPKKGFADLISAAAQLRDAGTPVDVTIAGDGDLTAELNPQIAAASLQESVRLIGPRTQSEIRDLIADADVFAAPCVPADDGNIDGLPTVVLESMAIGTPVIATAVTGLPEVIVDGDTGILLQPGDVDGLAAALRAFADGALPAQRMAANARALIEDQFDSRRQAATLSAWQNGASA